jgi:hypothetical protein
MKKNAVDKKVLRLAKETLASLQVSGQATDPITCGPDCATGSNPLCTEPDWTGK